MDIDREEFFNENEEPEYEEEYLEEHLDIEERTLDSEIRDSRIHLQNLFCWKVKFLKNGSEFFCKKLIWMTSNKNPKMIKMKLNIFASGSVIWFFKILFKFFSTGSVRQ